MASGPISSWQIDGETMETVTEFIFLGSKITADGDCSHEIKRRSLEEKLWETYCCSVLYLVAQSCPTPCDPMYYSPPGSSFYGDSPGKNTRVGGHALLHGIFPTQGLNPGLPHCRWIPYHLSHQGNPRILEWVAYPFSRGSSQSRNWTGVSCIAGGFFSSWATREALTNLDSILKSRNITLLTKVCIVKAMVFPIVMYGCQSWTVKKAECQRIDAFKLWCCRRHLRVPWTARKSNQSIPKEINPEYSLEGVMLKRKF